MLKKLSTMAAIVGLSFSVTAILTPNAFAQGAPSGNETFYGEIGYAYVPFNSAGYNLGSFGIGLIRGGINIHKNFSAEALIGVGITDASFYVGSTLITTKINNMYGFYAKPKFQVADNVELFGRVGYTNVDVTASSRYGGVTGNSGSLSYGLGAQVDFNKSVYGQLDWMSYYGKNGDTGRGPSISVGVKF